MPRCVATKSSSLPLVNRTQHSSSPSFKSIAMMPPLRAVWNCSSAVRLIRPLRVTMHRYFCVFDSRMRIIDVTRSSCVIGKRFAMFMPLLVRLPSGIS